ncbi:hypothetical protein GQ457_17G009700 [Hibiscus cannabinus]
MDVFLVYGGEEELRIKGYTDASFQTDKDDLRSQSGFVLYLNGGAVSWKSSKQGTVADSTTEAEYIAASEAAKEAVWIKKFITGLGVIPSISDAVGLYCDNNGAIAQANESRSHQRSKHILRRFYLIREIIDRGDVEICKVHTYDNIVDPLDEGILMMLETFWRFEMINYCWVMVGYRFGVVSGYFGCESDAKSSYNVELMFLASFDSKMGCLYSVFDVKKQGKPVWVVRTRNWKLRGGENRLSGLLEGVSIASLGKARRQGRSRITFVQVWFSPDFYNSGVEYRYPISGISTQIQHWNLGIGEGYRYPSSPLGLEYRYWLLSTDTSCLKTVFGTP